MTRLRWAAVGVVVLAVALRGWMLTTPALALDGDEATTGLMARDIAGGRLYAFFAGQSYMGALEQYLQAPFAALWPTSTVAFRVPQVLLAGLTVWLVLLVGLRVLSSPRRAVLAAALYAVGPAFTVLGGARSRGAYVSAIVVGLLGLLVVLWRAAPPGPRRAASFGACCGLGVWLTPVSAVLLLPAGAWFAPYAVRRPRLLVAALAGLALGASPVWGWSLLHGEVAGLAGAAPATPLADRLAGLLTATLPELLGLAWRSGEPLWPRWTWAPVLLALGAAWAVAAWRRRAGLAAVLTLRTAGRRPVDLVVLAVPLVAAVYLSSGYTWWTVEPRYLLAASPWLVLGLAALPAPAGRGPFAAGVLLAVFAATSAAGLATAVSRGPATWHDDLAAAGERLVAAGTTHAYADFRVAHTLDLRTGGRVVAVPYAPTPCRFPERTRAVDAAPRIAYVSSRDHLAATLAALEGAGVRVAQRWDYPTLVVLLPERPVRPWQAGLRAQPPSCSRA